MKISLPILLLLVLHGCKTGEKVIKDGNARHPKINVKAGVNKGGITENTDMSVIENTSADAFTGATETGFHVGTDYAYPVGRNYIEAGVNYMYNKQVFTYAFARENYYGKRSINTSQILLPVTFNAGLFRKKQKDGFLQFHIGYVLQYNVIGIHDSQPALPEFNIYKWSNGITAGMTIFPMLFDNGSRLGWYLSGYRGSQVYEDFFNLMNFEIPGSSYFKTGIIYQFQTK